MCHCLSTLNQSIPATCRRVFYVLSTRRLLNMELSLLLHQCQKLIYRSTANLLLESLKSIYITNSINLSSASPIPWRVCSFVPSPSSTLACMPEKLPEISLSKLSLQDYLAKETKCFIVLKRHTFATNINKKTAKAWAYRIF